MGSLPSGTVTFLFTDIEGSARLAQKYPEKWESLRKRHHEILQYAMDAHNGYVFQIIGDAFCVAFHTIQDGLHATLDAQRKLQNEQWGETLIKVRMGIHTGSAELHGVDYQGYLTMVKVQRVMSVAYGGQVLLSNASAELIRDELPEGTYLLDMKENQLKGLPEPEHLWQLVAADLSQEFPPLISLKETPNNLPLQLTSFIGRKKEAEQIKKLMERNRLITLTGSGGIGKTRLAIQLASELLDDYPDGVWLVELASVTDPALVHQTLCTVLRIIPDGSIPALDALRNYLSTRNVLLVMDNCEHLIDACAQLSEVILRACPLVRILASSREALGIEGEYAYRLPSLSLPASDTGLQAIDASEAVKLFLERAGAIVVDFKLTESNAPVIAQICRRLDGIALAIELAASRLRLLNVEQIAARLDDAFRFLTGGSRTALPRQQTLRALIDWSYNLLPEGEREVFREFSVFLGGWTVEAAEALCDRTDTLDRLAHLVDKSLVAVDLEHSDGPRYYYLETIRQYARERLAGTENPARLRDRHLDYFLKFAEQAETKLKGREQKKWLSRLEAEHDNLRASLEWSLQSRPALGLRMAAALSEFWDTHGHLAEARKWLDRLLNATQSLPSDSTRVRALIASMAFASRQTDLQGWMSPLDQTLMLSQELNDTWGIAQCLILKGFYKEYFEGKIEDAEPLYAEALNLARNLGDKLFLGHALGPMASYALKHYEHEHAAEIYNESLMLFREVENEREIAGALENLAEVELFHRDYQAAYGFAQESLTLYRDLEDKHGMATALRTLCHVMNNLGQVENAREAGEQSVNLFRDLTDRGCLGLALVTLARTVQAGGELQRASVLAREATAVLHEAGDQITEVIALEAMGRIALEQGDIPNAREYFGQGLEIGKEIQDLTLLPSLLEGLGATLAISSRSHDAILLLGAASAIREKTRLAILQIERSEYDHTLSLLHSQVRGESFQKIWDEGSALSAEQVVTFIFSGNV